MVGEALMDRPDILGLFLHFLLLSAMAIGGTQTVMPDMYRYVVDTHHWITGKQFADAFALAQAAPGPNVMYVTLIGWQVAGWIGAIATTLALVLPATAGTLLVMRLSARNPDAPFGRAIRSGLAPIAIGLTLSSGWILMGSVNQDWRGYLITALTVVILMRTRLNPLWLIAAGAAAGVAGLV
jgi:chromate transporter